MSDAGTTISLTYLSRATSPMTSRDLEELLTVSRDLNARDGVTGMLLYADAQFIQTLEGDEGVVEATMDRIRTDARHRDVDVTWVEPIEARFFPEWTMGFRSLDPEDMAGLRGFTDFLNRRGVDGAVAGSASGRALTFHRWFRDSLPLSD